MKVQYAPTRYGDNVRRLRIQACMKQSELADKLGLQQPHISRIERNDAPLTLDNAVEIARLTGGDLKDLILEKPPK